MNVQARPVNGPLFTRAFLALLGLGTVGAVLIVWRFLVGLGRATGMSDGYPLGLWIALDVVTGTALACGGYAMALVVYVFNKGKYHPLVRPAVLTSALGYTLAGLSVVVDLGRPWNMWKIPLQFWNWNLNSPLLEVALCIMAYVVVVWIELSPAFLERFSETGPPGLQKFAKATRPYLEKALVWILALGILLPTMHQSSLGALMMLAGPKVHALWFTPLLPLFFLITCIAMGYAMVVFESVFSSMAFGHKVDVRMLSVLEKLAVWLGVAFVVIRSCDLVVRGQAGSALRADLYSAFFWLEIVLWVLPVAFVTGSKSGDLGSLFRGAMCIALGGALYRFDTYLVAYQPGPGWHYFPSVPEMFISFGLIAMELAAYIALVKTFPIVGGIRSSQSEETP